MFLFVFTIQGCKKENTPPSCIILNPDNGTEVVKGEDISISVNANDDDGEVTGVEFYINDSIIGKTIIPPYEKLWNTEHASIGEHSIKAVSIDNVGATASDEITIIIQQAVEVPIADFSVSATTIELGDTIQYFDMSSNTPTSWLWDFGDGNTSTEQNPVYIYSVTDQYTVRLTVHNSKGTDQKTMQNYISVMLCLGCETGTITDYDENTYKTVRLGKQWWMAENIKTTHFSDGTSIPAIEDIVEWSNLGTEGVALDYDKFFPSYAEVFGARYTWPAAMKSAGSCNSNPSMVQGVCPNGWHLPSDEEWKQLELYLGMSENDVNEIGINDRGTKEGSMLAGNTDLWDDGVLKNATEFGTSGFQALPGGWRQWNGYYNGTGSTGSFWTSTQFSDEHSISRSMKADRTTLKRGFSEKNQGYSVRCVKD